MTTGRINQVTSVPALGEDGAKDSRPLWEQEVDVRRSSKRSANWPLSETNIKLQTSAQPLFRVQWLVVNSSKPHAKAKHTSKLQEYANELHYARSIRILHASTVTNWTTIQFINSLNENEYNSQLQPTSAIAKVSNRWSSTNWLDCQSIRWRFNFSHPWVFTHISMYSAAHTTYIMHSLYLVTFAWQMVRWVEHRPLLSVSRNLIYDVKRIMLPVTCNLTYDVKWSKAPLVCVLVNGQKRMAWLTQINQMVLSKAKKPGPKATCLIAYLEPKWLR